MNLLRIFGTNVRRLREEKGLSQEALADKSDLHRTYISDIERFQRNISLDNIQKIAKALNVEPYELLMEDTKNE